VSRKGIEYDHLTDYSCPRSLAISAASLSPRPDIKPVLAGTGVIALVIGAGIFVNYMEKVADKRKEDRLE
jgi:hypothetical protein